MPAVFLKLHLSYPQMQSFQTLVNQTLRGLGLFATVIVVFIVVLFTGLPAHSVEPDEILEDPVLETRAREISKEIRCLVCRNESIDDSHANLARDLRLLVRERIVAGDDNQQVKQYLVDRFGEYVLLKPPFSLANAGLWLAGPLIFLAGLLISVRYIRAQRPVASAPLSDEEQVELDRILKG